MQILNFYYLVLSCDWDFLSKSGAKLGKSILISAHTL